jgi:flagellar basal body P-ring formation protein FlgA
MERRPKAEVTGEAASRDRTLGMQLRRPMRAGTPIRVADIVKPDFVQRDQNVTVIYQVPGIYLTTRGKAIESGAEGDTISVLNLQTKRTLSGVVTGRGQVTVQGASQAAPMPAAVEQTSSLKRDETPAPAPTAAALAQSLIQTPASPAQIAQAQIPPVRVSQAPAKSE